MAALSRETGDRMTEPLAFPFAAPPEIGETIEVVAGIFWLRLALPFRLDHVNVYLIEDGDGFAVIDTGIGDARTQAIWQTLLDGILRDRPITRIVATHFHPDHSGMVGWLTDRTRAPVLMSQAEYLTSLVIRLDPDALDDEPYRSFYRHHGLDEATTASLLTSGNRYLKMLTGLPRTFRRLIAGETLVIGRRRFEVLTGGGHSLEQVMLHCPEERLLLCADQVLARISPNIGVSANDPEGDPLGIYLRSLAELRRTIPAGTLALPGHNLPFTGLHARIDELAVHHAQRCAAVLEACHTRSRTAAELVGVMFKRPLEDAHQMGFAFGETLAHINLLCREERLVGEGGRYRAVEQRRMAAMSS